MGNIGDQLSLVFVVILQGFRHKVHGIGDKAKLVLPVHLDRGTEISEGVFSGDFPDLPDGPADDEPDHEGEEDDQKHEQDLRYIKGKQISFFFLHNNGHGRVDRDVSAHMVVVGHRDQNAQRLFGKHAEKVSDHVVFAAGKYGIEIRDLHRFLQDAGGVGVQKQFAVPADQPDACVQIDIQGSEPGLNGCQSRPVFRFFKIISHVLVRHVEPLLIESGGSGGHCVLHHEMRGKRRDA